MFRALLAPAVIALVGLMPTSTVAGHHPPPSIDGLENIARGRFADPRGARKGDAVFRQTPNGVLLKVDLARMPRGIHAFHIHEVGACDPPDFASAGGHLAADGQAHGVLGQAGAHLGDLPNLHVPPSGELAVELFLRDLSLTNGSGAILDDDGAALVIHAGPDDYRSDPAGNSGARIACAVIVPAR